MNSVMNIAAAIVICSVFVICSVNAMETFADLYILLLLYVCMYVHCQYLLYV